MTWTALLTNCVTNSMVKLLFFRFRVTNSRLKNKKIRFELLARWVHFVFSLSSSENEFDKSKEFLKYYNLNVREPLEIDTTT